MSPQQNRRHFIKRSSLGALGLSLSVLGGCSRFSTERRPPNIIYILADDLGYGELGCYGQQRIRTPHIDSLAGEGMRFNQHYAGSPVCAPSRCVLMTGKHTGHAFIRNNGRPKERPHDPTRSIFAGQNPIPADEITIAELLKSAGYATASIGKWGLGFPGSAGDPNRQGFDLFYGFNCQVHAHNHYPRFLWRDGRKERLSGNDRTLSGSLYSQDLFIKEALNFIKKNQKRPFFLYLPVTIPHLSIQVPEKSLNAYLGLIPEAAYTHRGYLKHPQPRAAYAAMISHLDEGVGRITAYLKELGIENETLLIFSSDNGPAYDRLGGSDSDFFQSAGIFRGLKGSLNEGGIRVPLITRWPGLIQPGSVSDHVCAFWDILPTFCELAGVKVPAGRDGISFAATILGRGDQKNHEHLYWEFPGYGGQQAVRMGEWKGIRTGLKRPGTDTAIRLYHLDRDPGEKENLSGRYPDTVEKIHRIMLGARVESDLFPFPEIHTRSI